MSALVNYLKVLEVTGYIFQFISLGDNDTARALEMCFVITFPKINSLVG